MALFPLIVLAAEDEVVLPIEPAGQFSEGLGIVVHALAEAGHALGVVPEVAAPLPGEGVDAEEEVPAPLHFNQEKSGLKISIAGTSMKGC